MMHCCASELAFFKACRGCHVPCPVVESLHLQRDSPAHFQLKIAASVASLESQFDTQLLTQRTSHCSITFSVSTKWICRCL